MSLNLITPADPNWAVLFKPAVEVKDIKTEVVPHLREMRQLMERGHGAGLAAPQVGLGLRFFIYGGRWMGHKDLVLTMVNPVLNFPNPLKEDGIEGCLSFPGQKKSVLRYFNVEVTYMDLIGNVKTLEFDGLVARVIQHEVDHLNGTNLFDREPESQPSQPPT